VSEVDNSIDAPAPHVAAAMLVRALKQARWITFWERLWPPLAAVATAVGLFLAVSWAGAWLWLPPIGRAVALFVFLVLTAAATVPLIFVRFPKIRALIPLAEYRASKLLQREKKGRQFDEKMDLVVWYPCIHRRNVRHNNRAAARFAGRAKSRCRVPEMPGVPRSWNGNRGLRTEPRWMERHH
jgi:hypothetical protein